MMRKASRAKGLCLLVVMLIVATSNSFAQASFETIDGIRYLIDSDAKTAAVVPSNGEKYSGDVVVPEKVRAQDGVVYPVTAFGENAFKECYKLTSISIPSSVKTLGNYCFNSCGNLTSVTIPSSVTTLGNYCFEQCASLVNITVPSSVTSVGEHCFSNCRSLTSITLPSSVTFLGKSCFQYSSSLTNVSIPSSITSLEYECFEGCTSLTSITIPSSVTFLGSWCFHDCSALKSITIPSVVTQIGSRCFQNCSALTSITIPSSVKEIGSDCFYKCSNLESVIFKGECPDNTINSSLVSTCILYVPKLYLQSYKDALGSKYPYIYASKDDGQGEDKPSKICATPTITYSDGELQFVSATDGAQYHYTIADADITSGAYSEDGKVQLAAAYNITAYATAEGYQASEKATATLYWVKANGNLENTTTDINQAKTRGIVATSHDGFVTLSGLDNGEDVRFYAVDGKLLGSAKAIDGVASQAIPAASASLVIAKIGGQSIKIAVK